MMLLPAMLLASRETAAQAGPGPTAKAGARKPAEPTPEEKAKAQARKYYLSGNRMAAIGQWDDAFAEHAIAWRLHQDWEIAGGLGKSAYRTGHHAIAILRLTYHLANAPPRRVSATERSTLEKWMAESRKQVGFVAVTAPAGAAIFVDGDPVGTAPLPEPIAADPGKHEIQVQNGAETQKTTTTVTRGATSTVTLVLPTDAATGGGGTGGTTGTSTLRIAGLAGGAALFAGGIAVGGAFVAIASDHGALKQEAATDPNGRDRMAEAARAEAEARSIAFWGFVGAAVAAAGTTTFYLKTRTPGGATVTGAAGVRSGGPFLSIQGEF